MTRDMMWWEDYVIIPLGIALISGLLWLVIMVGAQQHEEAERKQQREDLRATICETLGYDGGSCARVCE